jgi:aminobenzoyl-glutamate utilization protein B
MWALLTIIFYLPPAVLNYYYEKIILSFFSLGFFGLQAQTDHSTFLNAIDANAAQYSEVAQTIWSYAEMGYQETFAAEGFTIEKGIAGIPTAFSATYGTDGPVIAILGEYDALPGLSQKTLPYKVSNNTRAGHGLDTICLEPHLPLQQ